MRCIATDIQDEHIFQIRLHGGKVKGVRNNYRKHIQEARNRQITPEEKQKLDRLGDNLLRKQENIGRQRTGN